MNLVCRNCNWETNEKHFGYVDKRTYTTSKYAYEDLHLCILCYSGKTDRARENAIKTRKEIDNAE